MTKNHPRIKSVAAIKSGGWHVMLYGKYQQYVERSVITERTVSKNGQPLKRAVKETTLVREFVPASGLHGRVVKRRKTLRKMGVRNVPR